MPLEKQDALTRLPLRGRRAWVVGCGFLGSCLLSLCREEGMQVLGIDHQGSADVQGDAASPSVLAAARSRLEPEFIFCCVATHGGDEAAYHAAYRRLPLALHAACPSARLLFCSSSSVYAGQGGELVSEDSPCRAVSARARILVEAESAVLAMGGMVARLVPLYGAGRCELLRRFVQREPELPGADSRFFNYVHQVDAARALLLLAQAGVSAPVNVCAEFFSKGEVYAELSRLTALPRVPAGAPASRRGVSDQRVSSVRLRALGWEPRVQFIPWAADCWRNWS